MFELSGSGQHIVGIVGGVGLKMLQHHGEKVLARKPLHYLGGLRCNSHRVAVVHHQRRNGRPKGVALRPQQVITDGAHVDGAWGATIEQVGAL